MKKPWLKANLKDINNLINNKTFSDQGPEKGEPVNPCMDGYKAKIQSDGSFNKLKLRIVVRRYLQNKQLFGDTWSPTASMRTSKYKAIVYQLDILGAFL